MKHWILNPVEDKMKTQYKILIASIPIISIFLFLQAPLIIGQPECNDEILDIDYDCDLWNNWDWVYYNLFENYKVFTDLDHAKAIKEYSMIETSCNNSTGHLDSKCFVNSFEKCESASIKQMGYTFEGDPIFSYATIIPKQSCTIHFKMDVSLDKWKGIANPDIIEDTCTNIQLSEHKINLQCENAQRIIQLRG